MKSIFRNICEQISDGLEQSTIGTLVMFGCFGLITALTIKEGGTDTVDNLITTAMIVAASLLGVNSVADVFKVNKNVTVNKGNQQTTECSQYPTEYNQTNEPLG